MTHGFITIATGDAQYYKMAVNLLRTAGFPRHRFRLLFWRIRKTNIQRSLMMCGFSRKCIAIIWISWKCSHFCPMT